MQLDVFLGVFVKLQSLVNIIFRCKEWLIMLVSSHKRTDDKLSQLQVKFGFDLLGDQHKQMQLQLLHLVTNLPRKYRKLEANTGPSY